MDSIEITEVTAHPSLGIVPSHKISISHGSDVYVYWYVKQKLDCRDFDKIKDMDLVNLMHAKGMKMDLGDFVSFNINNVKDYHLERRDSHDFIIQSLN